MVVSFENHFALFLDSAGISDVSRVSPFHLEIARFLFTFHLSDARVDLFFREWEEIHTHNVFFTGTTYHPKLWRPLLRDKLAYKYWFSLLHSDHLKEFTIEQFLYSFYVFKQRFHVWFRPRDYYIFLDIIERQTDDPHLLTKYLPYHEKVLIQVKNFLFRRNLVHHNSFYFPQAFGLTRVFVHVLTWRQDSDLLSALVSSPWFTKVIFLGEKGTNLLFTFIIPIRYKRRFLDEIQRLKHWETVFKFDVFSPSITTQTDVIVSSGYRAYDRVKRQWDIHLMFPNQYYNIAPRHAREIEISLSTSPLQGLHITHDLLRVVQAFLQDPSLSIRDLQKKHQWSYRKARVLKNDLYSYELVSKLFSPVYSAFNLESYMLYLENYHEILGHANYFLAQPFVKLVTMKSWLQGTGSLLVIHSLPLVMNTLTDLLMSLYAPFSPEYLFWVEHESQVITSKHLIPIQLFDEETQKWAWVPLGIS